MRDFKKLLIWQKGMEIVKECYKAAVHFPKEERFGMRSQFTRSALSIPSNIAEGSAKRSEKDYKRFIEIVGDLLSQTAQEQKMLSSFLSKL